VSDTSIPTSNVPAPQGKSNKAIIAILILVVIWLALTLCAVVVIVILALLGPSIGNIFSNTLLAL
jgi:hypothetical protein